jgi:hypothetical protein
MTPVQPPLSRSRTPGPWNAAPPLTPDLLAAARANPGQEISVIDPAFHPDARVPGWGIRGYFPVSDRGDVQVQGWVPNPGYRPGPRTLGFPQPRNRVERQLQLAAAGYEPTTALIRALAEAEVTIPVTAEHPDQIPVLTDDEGQRVVVVFTRADLVSASTLCLTVPTTVLGPIVASTIIRINPGLQPSAELPGRDLITALAATAPNSIWP